MTRVLCYLIHATPEVHARYVAAAKERGIELTLIHVVVGNGSQVYRDYARQLKQQQSSVLNGLFAVGTSWAAKYGLPRPEHPGNYDLIGVACFSAGYGTVMELLADERDAMRLDFVCGIDSFYASKAKDGTPVDAQIAPLVKYANRARGCPIACWLGFTDVRTYTYSETGDVAREVWLVAHGEPQNAMEAASKIEKLLSRQDGGLRIRGYDLTPDDKLEHSWALTRWGPDWLADCIAATQQRRIDAGITPHPGRAAAAQSSATEPVLRTGDRGAAVSKWQQLLGQHGVAVTVDGVFGPKTDFATRAAQQQWRLVVDGIVGPKTWAAAQSTGGVPPAPGLQPLNSAELALVFGRINHVAAPTTSCPEAIRITNDWQTKNIVVVEIPQLKGIQGAHSAGRVACHRLIAQPLQQLFSAWESAGELSCVTSWDGLYVPRYVRGQPGLLSEHAYGVALDINAAANPYRRLPRPAGQPGSVVTLVAIANQLHWWWRGHSDPCDPMHFVYRPR